MPKPHVYVTRRIPAEALEVIDRSCTYEVWDEGDAPVPSQVLAEKAKTADGLFTLLTEQITDELLVGAPRVRVVSNMAVGFDNIDVEAATRRGVLVANTPDVLTETSADLAWSLLMAAARRIPQSERALRDGKWDTWKPMEFTGQDVYGATLGIIGLGRIGAAVARRALGFGMKVIYHGRRRVPALEAALNAQYRTMEELLSESDFVSLHCPLTEGTHHLIGEREFAKMRSNAVLINTSRGPVVDEEALYRALETKQIWAAGLDVWEKEPVNPQHPLLSLDNVVALPHIGSASIKTRTRMAVLAANNLVQALTGQLSSVALVNPEVLDDAAP